MVRSRSETNLNNIFLDLCTSPEVRSKCTNTRPPQRASNPPLPALKPIISISHPDLTQISQDDESQSSPLFNIGTDTLDLTSSFPLPSPIRREHSPATSLNATPLSPMESTGFVVQTTTFACSSSSIRQEQERFS